MLPVDFLQHAAGYAAQINHVVNKILRIFNLPENMIEWKTPK